MRPSIVVFFTLIGCTAGPPRPPADEKPCPAVCEHMRALGCPEGSPTPEGATCEDLCVDVQRSGVLVIDTECMLEASTCDEASAC